MYKWWVLVHLAGVFVFLVAHGVSVGVLFRLRRERDPSKVAALIELSASSVRSFYVGLVVLLVGGFAAVATGDLWSKPWIWIALGVLVISSVGMVAMARPYYRRVGFVSRAMVGGTEVVTKEQFDEVLRDNRSNSVAAMGFVALAIILYMMVIKPTFGVGPGAPPAAQGCEPSATVQVSASGDAFDTDCLAAPAGRAFKIVFDNQDTDSHNVAIYSGSKNLFRGLIFGGPKTETYRAPPLKAGTYKFQCDVHTFMNGTFKVEAAAAPSPAGS
ncbi:MAG: cupredoxin domain-containing protein [Actinomycetota bacterium]